MQLRTRSKSSQVQGTVSTSTKYDTPLDDPSETQPHFESLPAEIKKPIPIDFELPPGWRLEIRERKSGGKKKRDKIWYDPEGKMYRSRAHVLQRLATITPLNETGNTTTKEQVDA